MGANAGPDIVSDGLVLALDAADNNSFRGEPTTNLTTNTPSQNGWGGAYTVVDSDSKTFTIKTQQNNAATTSAWRTWYWSVSSYIGSTVTISADVEFVEESNATFYFITIGQGNTGQYPYHIPGSNSSDRVTISTKPTQKISMTWSGVINATGIVGFTQWINNVTANGGYSTLKITNVQIEVKASKTRFVNGTRGTTVATGGGWADISGNDNHGEILNGTSTSNDGSVLGALDFDGTNDYIDLGTQLNDLTVFTVEGVFKTNITGGVDTFQVIFGAGPLNTSNYTNISIGNLTSSYPDESFHVVLKATTLQFYVRNGANFYFDQKYHHFVVNTEANKNAVYIDGVEQSLTYSQGSSAVDWGGINSLGASNVCAIGRRSYNGGTGYFNGNIPFIRVYNRSLTEKEILANYNSLKTRFGL